MDYLRIPILSVVMVSIFFTVSGLKCQNCQSIVNTNEAHSSCYDGTETNMETCGLLTTCGSAVGLVDVVPKDSPNQPPVQKSVAIRGCVSSLAGISIHGCTTDASPYMDMVNSKSEEYTFSNFVGKICLCNVDGCSGS